jgi:hypothetical protein
LLLNQVCRVQIKDCLARSHIPIKVCLVRSLVRTKVFLQLELTRRRLELRLLQDIIRRQRLHRTQPRNNL